MKTLLKTTLVSILVVIISACSDRNFEPLGSDATILAFGDSLTFGVGASNKNDYPTRLAKLTDRKVVNSGISGETTAQGLKRFESEIQKYSPDFLILLEGGNDILQNKSSETTKQNLSEMIKIAQQNQIQILLIGVPEKKLFSNSAPLYQEIADEFQLIFDGEILSDLLRSTKYKSDPVHLNNAGYQKLADEIFQIMQNRGAL